MKKILALVLVLLMLFSLVACGGTASTTTDTAKPAEEKTPAATTQEEKTEDATEATSDGAVDLSAAGGFGFWNAVKDHDFSKEERHKIGLISYGWDQMLQTIADNMAVFAERANCDFVYTDSDSNAETLINNVELFASQGCEGLIINSFSTYVDTVIDLCDELGIPWWSLSEPMVRQSTGELMAPYMMTNDYQWGYDVGKYCAEYALANFENFDASKTKVLGISLTTLTVFCEREQGFHDAMDEYLPGVDYELCDGLAEGGISAEVGYSIASTRGTANPDKEFWIYFDVMGYFAPGALQYVQEQGKDDVSLIGSCSGDTQVSMLKKGTEGCWKVNLYMDYSMGFSAPFFCVYAVVAGWGTYEDIWADTKGPGDKYGHVDTGYVNVTQDNYQDYLAFCDSFQELNNYPEYTWSGKVYTVVYGDGGATE